MRTVEETRIDMRGEENSSVSSEASTSQHLSLEESVEEVDNQNETQGDGSNRPTDRHANAQEIYRMITELRREDAAAGRYLAIVFYFIPFIAIWLLKAYADNVYYGTCLIANFIALQFSDLQCIVAAKSPRSRLRAIAAMLPTVALALLSSFFFDFEAIVPRLLYEEHDVKGPTVTFFSTLYAIAMCDLCVKHVTVFIKATVTLLPKPCCSAYHRSSLYQVVEYSSQLVRCIPPFLHWSLHFVGRTSNSHPAVNVALFCAYFVLKLFEMLRHVRPWMASLEGLLSEASYTKATEEEVTSAGDCSICQENFKIPVRLKCSHIFCTDCITEWLATRSSCPLCRANILQRSRKWTTAATAQYFKLY